MPAPVKTGATLPPGKSVAQATVAIDNRATTAAKVLVPGIHHSRTGRRKPVPSPVPIAATTDVIATMSGVEPLAGQNEQVPAAMAVNAGLNHAELNAERTRAGSAAVTRETDSYQLLTSWGMHWAALSRNQVNEAGGCSTALVTRTLSLDAGA